MPDEESGQPAQRFFHPDLAPPAENQPAEVPGGQPGPEPVQKVFVGGRERTLDEVVQGYDASTNEAMKLREELATARAEREADARIAAAYKEMYARPVPVPEPPDLSNADAGEVQQWIERIAEQKAARIAEDRAGVAEQQLKAFIGGLQGLQNAQAAMKQRDAEFDPTKVQDYLTAHPDAQSTYSAISAQDQVAALDYAWTKAKPQKREDDKNGARAVQSTPSTKVGTAQSQGDREKMLKNALAEAERTGMYEKYYAIRFKNTSVDREADFKRQ